MEDQSTKTNNHTVTIKPRKIYLFLPFIFILLSLDTPFVKVPKLGFLLENLVLFAVLEIIFYISFGRAYIIISGGNIVSRYVRSKTIETASISHISATRGGLTLVDNAGNKMLLPLAIYPKKEVIKVFDFLKPYLPSESARPWRLRTILKSYHIDV